MKSYKIGFDRYGLLLFAVIMLPNLIWFAVPAPNDILRTEPAVPVLDAVGSVFRVISVFFLCFIVRTERQRLRLTPPIAGCAACCLLYGVCWIFYYTSVTSAPILLGMTLLPCAAFLLFAIGRKNNISLILISVFTVCHLLNTILAF